jgi:hypothetical protein
MSGITQCMTTSFKVDCLSGVVNFAAGTPYTYKIALYSVANGASLDATTTTYASTTGEVIGTGYTATGQTLTVSQVPSSSGTPTTTAFINFANVTWTGATFSADGALIYNATTGRTVAVLNFGGTKTVSAGTFTVQFPVAGSGAAIVQIA